MDTKTFDKKFTELKKADEAFANAINKWFENSEKDLAAEKAKSEELSAANKDLEAKVKELELQLNQDANRKLIKELHEQNEALKKKAEDNPENHLYVDGEYKSAKNGAGKGKTFKFKKGFVKTRNQKGEIIPSEEVLEDEELMEWLIDRGYGGLEVVE